MIQYLFYYTFSAIDSVLNQDNWDPEIDSPTLENKEVDNTPQNWYTQY